MPPNLPEKRPLLMGIVNVTPDSFSDGGLYDAPQKAIAHGLKLAEEGADILDIGGESTRPGSAPVGPQQEMDRILPVIEGLAACCGALLSVDTRHAATMKAALAAGAKMINDVTALAGDPDSLSVAASSGASVCLMHMQGEPGTMQDHPHYNNVIEDVLDFLSERIRACERAGIGAERIIVDPGIGFGKTVDHNLDLIRGINRLKTLGVPVLIGVSRKSFIGRVTGGAALHDPKMRLPGSLACALWAAGQGVDILRVHDVAETRQALEVYQGIAPGDQRFL